MAELPKEGRRNVVCIVPLYSRKKMCRKLKKMYFPAEMLKPMLCMHERLLQEAPCQRGMTNKEHSAVMLRTCIHILRLLQRGRGTWSSLPLPRSRVARGCSV